MATCNISKKSFVLFAAQLLATVCSQDSPSSWAKLQISPNELCSMPFGSFRVNIYEHADNSKLSTLPARYKYFYAPIALLDHASATSSYNNVTKQPEIRFRIEMWNDKVESEVVEYLGRFIGQPVHDHQVQVIPLEKVVLVNTIPSTAFSLSNNWLPYQLHKFLQFSMSCFAQNDCDQLALDMRSNPEQFDHLKLLFSLSSQTSQTKETTIRIDNVVSGQMVSNLLQRFGQKDEILLTANDEKRLLIETTTNILVETFDDSDVVSPNSESQIYNTLKNLLFSNKTVVKEQSEKMWDLVFWNEENYRPDKAAKTLNEVYKKLDVESKKKLSELYKNMKKMDGQENVLFDMVSAKVSVKTDFAKHGSTSKDDIDKFYQESKGYVEWGRDQFVPKPLALSKINLTQLREKHLLKDRKVVVRYSIAVLSIPINFVQYRGLTVTDEWRNLKDELKETRATLLNLKKDLNERTSAIEDIGRIPMSCADLRKVGHKKSGLFSIMGQKMMETVHCNFSKQSNEEGFQKLVGYVDIKSSPVYFHAQKTSSYANINTGIPFEKVRINVGNAMNLPTGIFVAPRPGKYYFSYSGISESNEGRVLLQMKTETEDWLTIGQGYSTTTFETFSLQSTLQLRKGDQIRLFLLRGSIHDNAANYFNFVGWLIEEDIFE